MKQRLLASVIFFLVMSSLNPLLGETTPDTFPAKDYISFTQTADIPEELLDFSPLSGDTLFAPKGKRPYIVIEGKTKDGVPLMINGVRVTDAEGRFRYELALPPEPTAVTFKILTKNLTLERFTRTYFWAKVPPAIRIRVKEESGVVVSKEKGFLEDLKRKAFTQLVSGNSPVTHIDLDTARQGRLAFLISYPQESGETYDSWALVIRDSQKRLIAEVKRYDNPPALFDFGEVANNIVLPGSYTYRTDLFKSDRIIEGTEAVFEAAASRGLAASASNPGFTCEPRQELGYFSFKNLDSFSTSGMFVGADLSAIFSGTYVARARGQFALPTANPSDFLTNAHLGVGIRTHLGKSRLDTTLSYTNYSITPTAAIRSFSHFTLSLEPQLLLWEEHYLVPAVEFGADSSFQQNRLGLNLTYQFFIRPWSMRFGTGVGYDTLFSYSPNPAMRFQVFRALAQMTFLL